MQHYPKPDYWANVIHQVQVKSGFASTRLGLDLSRLKLATGNLKANDYRDMAQAALLEHYPAEAKDVIDKAFAANLIGTGDTAARRYQAARLHQQGRGGRSGRHRCQGRGRGRGQGRQAMVDLGYDYVGYGQVDKGIKLMEDGIKADALKHPDDAKLHLALSYLRAGQKPKALAALKAVGGGGRYARSCSGLGLIHQFQAGRLTEPVDTQWNGRPPGGHFHFWTTARIQSATAPDCRPPAAPAGTGNSRGRHARRRAAVEPGGPPRSACRLGRASPAPRLRQPKPPASSNG
ncbi:MAG: hypothetical protein WDN69_16260 [Aliidongia sp.]